MNQTRQSTRESILIDLHMDNISNYNLKKSFAINQDDFLPIRDLDIDNNLFKIEDEFERFKKKSKNTKNNF